MSNPLDDAKSLIQLFTPSDEREERVAAELRKLIDAMSYTESAKVVEGPKITIAEVARKAELSRNLINSEKCELPGARTLIVSVWKVLADHNLEIRCSYLTSENSRLQRLVDYHVSETAGLVLKLGGVVGSAISAKAMPKKGSATPEQMMSGADILPMGVISVAGKQRE
ncbi:hypothetical protein [Pelomonas sp. SE-A7]|uniref:hypothetical protein n=1 Tax=Pelomonas sp. SE-A7 TaxID=3054953 RepID=UPI00259CC2A9|nr:hypothetical protein [Pelomonas sp. SE-A7]MDM4765987.1 hypothetical protein [Pelomonas sp. SE-A7]